MVDNNFRLCKINQTHFVLGIYFVSSTNIYGYTKQESFKKHEEYFKFIDLTVR